MIALQPKLDRGDVLILDGGMGSELQRRGVPVHNVAWSGAALQSHPDVVRQAHQDFIRVGADIITTNTFATARHVLERADMGGLVGELNRRAVTLAQEARDRVAAGRPVLIAGSISTFAGLGGRPAPAAAQAEASYREQATLLAEAGADLLVLEMMRDLEQTRYAVTAAVATGLPVWIGFSCRQDRESGEVRLLDSSPGEPFAAALEVILPLGGSVVTVMHTEVEDIAPALAVIRSHWSGPIGAYAHSGKRVLPGWQRANVISPDSYAATAREWVQTGVQIVGGCCGLGPEHIRLLREEFPEHTAE